MTTPGSESSSKSMNALSDGRSVSWRRGCATHCRARARHGSSASPFRFLEDSVLTTGSRRCYPDGRARTSSGRQRERALLHRPCWPLWLALRCNLAVVQEMLFCATVVRVEVEGNTRVLVRHAKWRGLICTVADRSCGTSTSMEISGPFALFRNTRLYGRALGELVPLLAWCPRFRLQAECVFQGRRLTLQLGAGDPLFPASTPRRYDSLLEERFALEFRRLAPTWDVIREPEPIVAGGTLIFPDFALQHRADPTRRWLLEIAGFWTPDYVARKLALYRSARRAQSHLLHRRGTELRGGRSTV